MRMVQFMDGNNMVLANRQYINKQNGDSVEYPYLFAGPVDESVIKQAFIDDVKANPNFDVVWYVCGKMWCT